MGITRSPIADLHLAAGATLAVYHGADVPARFGDPKGEYQAARSAAGLFDFSFRAKFTVSGPDRVSFLHNMLSNDVSRLAPGDGTYALLLNVKGQILADLRVYATDEPLIVDTDADLLDKVMSTLDRYIIMDDVSLAQLDVVAAMMAGPHARTVIERTLAREVPPLDEFGHFETRVGDLSVRVVRASNTGDEGYELWVEKKDFIALWMALAGQISALGGTSVPAVIPCGTEALEMLRIEAGIPRCGVDFGEDTIPLEAGLLNAISFTKGCYPGQEIVERSRSRGHVNWNLVGLLIDSPQPPPASAKLVDGTREVGEVTSACISPALERTIGLGYVRREFAAPGSRLALTSNEAVEVTSLPFVPRQQPSAQIPLR
jgi:glycine cleavage system T protein